MRIATPVCALARNDKIGTFSRRRRGRPPDGPPKSLPLEGKVPSEARRMRWRNDKQRSRANRFRIEAPPHPSSALRETADATFPSRGRLGDFVTSEELPQRPEYQPLMERIKALFATADM